MRASIRYIVRYTKIISKDCGNTKKLLPRVEEPVGEEMVNNASKPVEDKGKAVDRA